MATAAPLIIKNTAAIWLEERLYLKQLFEDDDQITNCLTADHATAKLPSYFDETTLNETTERIPGNSLFRIQGIPFPGDLIKKAAASSMSENGWWNIILKTNLQKEKQQLQKSLTMIESPVFDEFQVVDKIGRLSVIGIASGFARIFETLGLDPLHINLDALPSPDRERKLREKI
jgi:hypothetical protein